MGGVILPNHTSGMLRHPKQNVCGEGRQGNHTLSQPPCLLRENKEGPLEINPAFPEPAAAILELNTEGEECTWECGPGSWNLYFPQILL